MGELLRVQGGEHDQQAACLDINIIWKSKCYIQHRYISHLGSPFLAFEHSTCKYMTAAALAPLPYNLRNHTHTNSHPTSLPPFFPLRPVFSKSVIPPAQSADPDIAFIEDCLCSYVTSLLQSQIESYQRRATPYKLRDIEKGQWRKYIQPSQY